MTKANGSARPHPPVPGRSGTGLWEHAFELVLADAVWPFRVQVSEPAPLQVTVKTLSFWPGWKAVGWPWFCAPGEKALPEPIGIVSTEPELLL